ncbi:CZB domain-containing protein [Sulfurospirillum arsenophilum]|uniref:CZB domain-containing protein n=1 Tax=Sulfurospirillum arsenophilum TaxID=56698 RepID=UPI003F6F1849
MNHAIFKSNAYSAVYVNDKDTTFQDHETCSLGEWYQKDGQKIFGDTQSFKELYKPHESFHAHVLEVAKLIRSTSSNLLDEKEQIVNYFKEVEKESKVLFGTLDSMIAEKNAHA